MSSAAAAVPNDHSLPLQLIPQISSLTPITTLLPLVGVLSLTALKDGYDEVVRADNLHDSRSLDHGNFMLIIINQTDHCCFPTPTPASACGALDALS